MKKVFTTISIFGALYLLPTVALAQFGDIDKYVLDIAAFINGVLVPAVFALAFLLFLWGVFKYFFWGADPAQHDDGKKLMFGAIIGFLLMVSIWGIVNLLSKGLRLDDEDIKQVPNAPTRQL